MFKWLWMNNNNLEGDDAIEIGFVLRSDNGAVDFAVQLLKKVRFAQRRHMI